MTDQERTAHAARLAHVLGTVMSNYMQINNLTLDDIQAVVPQVVEYLRDASEHANQMVEARRAQMTGNVQ